MQEKKHTFPAAPVRARPPVPEPQPLHKNHECSFYGPQAAAFPFRSTETGSIPCESALLPATRPCTQTAPTGRRNLFVPQSPQD